MPKTKISEFSATPGNNTDIDGINLAEGCAPSGINDAIRELMAQLKDFQAGTAGDSFNGPIGSVTPAAGAFTTLSASGTTTLSGLTASTSLALDASKNVTSVTNTGTGNNVLATSPTLVTPNLGTPSAVTLTNATGLPISTGVSGMAAGAAAFLATPSSANLASLVTDETGTGALVFAGSPTFTGTVSGAALTLSGALTLNGGTANGVLFLNGSKVVSSGSGLVFDPSGNLGLGVTPSAWASSRALQIGSSLAPYMGLAQMTTGTADGYMLWGAYLTGNRTFAYTTTGDAPAAYRQNAGAHAWLTAPSGTAGNPISFTQVASITNGGNLLVGTTVDGDRLTVGQGRIRLDQDFQIVWQNAGTNRARIYGDSSNNFIFENGSANTERARITSGGDLLVGASATSANFDGRVNVAGRLHTKANSGTTALHFIWNEATSGDNGFVNFGTEGTFTSRGSITYNRAGGLVGFNTTSDYRSKDIIGPVQNTGATIDALKIYEGVMKGATQSRPMMIAHEAQAVVPFCVSGEKDAVNADGTPKFQQMDHASLVPLLIAEIQSLRARVAALESK